MFSLVSPGEKYGIVIILSYVGNRDGIRYFKAQCDCGSVVVLPEYRLKLYPMCSKCRDKRTHYGKIDPVGNTYGCYTILNFKEKRSDLKRRYRVRCKCGTEYILNWKTIQNAPVRCRACAATSKNIVGQKFGSLTVEARAGSDHHSQALWHCRCDCGNTSIVRGNPLRTGRIENCKECGKMRRKRTQALKLSIPLPILPGPFGCRCQTWTHHILGDRCQECNPELAAEITKERMTGKQ